MLHRCAWCGTTIEPSFPSQENVARDEEVTHEICLACTEDLLAAVRRDDAVCEEPLCSSAE